MNQSGCNGTAAGECGSPSTRTRRRSIKVHSEPFALFRHAVQDALDVIDFGPRHLYGDGSAAHGVGLVGFLLDLFFEVN